jgi:hypothetical protein
MADCVVACSAKLVGSSSMSVRKVSGIFLFIQDKIQIEKYMFVRNIGFSSFVDFSM